MEIALLFTCFNRARKTREMLTTFLAVTKQFKNIKFTIFALDDGSADNTLNVLEEFLDPKNILNGPGDYYWNRGMIKIYNLAKLSSKVFDGYMMVNDDVSFCSDGLKIFINNIKQLEKDCVLVGTCIDPISKESTYGGLLRNSRFNKLRFRRSGVTDDVQLAHTFNCNCVYVPSIILSKVGFLDKQFVHGMGDYDLGIRITDSNFRILISPGFVGYCARNFPDKAWLADNLKIAERLKLLHSPKGPPPYQYFRYAFKHQKIISIKYLISPYIRILLTMFRR